MTITTRSNTAWRMTVEHRERIDGTMAQRPVFGQGSWRCSTAFPAFAIPGWEALSAISFQQLKELEGYDSLTLARVE